MFTFPRSFLSIIFCILAIPIVSHAKFILDEGIERPAITEQYALINTIFTTYPKRVTKTTPWLKPGDTTWQALDIDLIIPKFDRTSTLGGAYIFKQLLQSISDLDELTQRRTALQKLVENEHSYATLQSLFEEYKDNEWLFLILYKKTMRPFPLAYRPEEAIPDAQRSDFDTWDPSKQVPWFIRNYVPQTPDDAYAFVENYRETLRTLYNGLLASQPLFYRGYQLVCFPWAFYLFYQFAFRTLGNNYRQAANRISELHTERPFWRILGYSANILPFIALTELATQTSYGVTAGAYEQFTEHNAGMAKIHGGMLYIAWIIRNIDILGSYIPEECWQVHDALKEWHSYVTEGSEHYNDNLARFVELLDDETFDTSPSANIAINFTKVCQAYSYVTSCKDKLATLFYAYAMADAHLSLAKLYKERQSEGYPVTWAEFSSYDKPMCRLENIVNPLVADEHAIANSFTLGDASHAHMMLTGPHGCGKTTSMKSIAYAYWMAQTLTFVFGTAAYMNVITHLATYLNITDNTPEGLSSFMAENKEIQKLRNAAHSLTVNDHMLMIVDEPYAKTLQEVGEKEVYEFVKDLAGISSLMMIVATHFEKPAILEQELGGMVKNYQPKLLERELGEFERTFEIIEGAAHWWFTDTEKRERFVDWLGGIVT
jgi:MutS domain V